MRVGCTHRGLTSGCGETTRLDLGSQGRSAGSAASLSVGLGARGCAVQVAPLRPVSSYPGRVLGNETDALPRGRSRAGRCVGAAGWGS